MRLRALMASLGDFFIFCDLKSFILNIHFCGMEDARFFFGCLTHIIIVCGFTALVLPVNIDFSPYGCFLLCFWVDTEFWL